MSDRSVQSHVAHDLRLAVFRLARRLRAERVAETVTDAEMAVLAYVSENGPATPGFFAARERVSAPAINRVVNTLEVAGLVQRTADPGDGRRVLIAPTQAGRTLAAETGRIRNAWLETQLESLTAEDRKTVRTAAAILQELAER